MPSLKDAGLPLYPAYSAEEIAIHYPQLLFPPAAAAAAAAAAASRVVEVISDDEEDYEEAYETDWAAFKQLAVPKPVRVKKQSNQCRASIPPFRCS